MPSLNGIVETALYVADLDRALAFYDDLFALPVLVRDHRFCALNVADRQVLLLFLQGAAREPQRMPFGTIPGHEAAGEIHVAFAVSKAELPDWEARLAARSIPIEGRVRWPRGGESVYFRDPDRHLLELATPGLWTMY